MVSTHMSKWCMNNAEHNLVHSNFRHRMLDIYRQFSGLSWYEIQCVAPIEIGVKGCILSLFWCNSINTTCSRRSVALANKNSEHKPSCQGERLNERNVSDTHKYAGPFRPGCVCVCNMLVAYSTLTNRQPHNINMISIYGQAQWVAAEVCVQNYSVHACVVSIRCS